MKYWSWWLLVPALLCGCEQPDMADQPRLETYETGAAFNDGLAARPVPELIAERSICSMSDCVEDDRLEGPSHRFSKKPRSSRAKACGSTGSVLAATPA